MKTKNPQDLFKQNIIALDGQDPGLAKAVSEMVAPAYAERVAARDGSVSFRFRQWDGRRPWLGHTSVPMIAAYANLQRAGIGSANVGMHGIGNGAEAELLLENMAPYQALFILEEDLTNIYLAFQLRDFGGFIENGQLILLVIPSEAGSESAGVENVLVDFYDRHREYQIIKEVYRHPWKSESENQQFAGAITRAMNHIVGAHSQIFQGMLDHHGVVEPFFAGQEFFSVRLTNYTHNYTETDYCTSRDILAGFESLGVCCQWFVLDRPDKASVLSQVRRIDEFRPHLIVLVDTFRDELSQVLDPRVPCLTVIRDRIPLSRLGPVPVLKSSPITSRDLVFYPLPWQRESLEQNYQIPEQNLVHLPLGVNDRLFCPEAEAEEQITDVVLIASPLSTDPEDYQIKLPTHQKLFSAVIELIRKSPADYHSHLAETFLKRGQSCGVQIKEQDLRDQFTYLIRHFFGPAVLRERYGQALLGAGFDVRLWEWRRWRERFSLPAMDSNEAIPEPNQASTIHSWKNSVLEPLLSGSVSNGADLNRLYHSVKIFLHVCDTGFPEAYLFNGIAAGAFFLVKDHPHMKRPGHLGDFFEIGRELITYRGCEDLVKKVRYYLEQDDRRSQIAQAARRKLLEHHSCAHRARQIIDALNAHLRQTVPSEGTVF